MCVRVFDERSECRYCPLWKKNTPQSGGRRRRELKSVPDVMDFDFHQLTTSRTCQSQSCANCASPPPHISPYLAVKQDRQHNNFCLNRMFSNICDLADPLSLFWESESRPHHLPSWAREWIVYPTITSLRGSQLATFYNRMEGALQFSFQLSVSVSHIYSWNMKRV